METTSGEEEGEAPAPLASGSAYEYRIEELHFSRPSCSRSPPSLVFLFFPSCSLLSVSAAL